MARLSKQNKKVTGYVVLLVDDDLAYLEVTERLLSREGHQVLTADSGPAALEILKTKKIDLLLLDFYMPGMTGEQVVSHLRQFNRIVQVVLQTGYSSEHPPREMLERLDIQGYYDKSEGPEKLLLWVTVGLKAAYQVQLLYRSREGLRFILEATPDLHKIQKVGKLLHGILLQVTGLLGAVDSFLAVVPECDFTNQEKPVGESYLVMLEDKQELVVHACSNEQQKSMPRLEKNTCSLIDESIRKKEVLITKDVTSVPLIVGDQTIGVIYLDRPALRLDDLEILKLFANQAAVAIHNAHLYEMATVDSLTGVYGRGFFERSLDRELSSAFVSGQHISLMMVDLDRLKQINDQKGHLLGDRAIARVGQVLKKSCRGADIIGRYGGDEFAVVLPGSTLEIAQLVAQRISTEIRKQDIGDEGNPIFLQCSIGIATLKPHSFEVGPPELYFPSMAKTLIKQADKSLYRAKENGRDQFDPGNEVDWIEPL